MSLGNAQFSMNFLKIIRPNVFFYEDIWCERKILQNIFQRNGEFFFQDFVTQYFVDIFSKPPRSCPQIGSGIAQFQTKHHKNNTPSVSFDKD